MTLSFIQTFFTYYLVKNRLRYLIVILDMYVHKCILNTARLASWLSYWLFALRAASSIAAQNKYLYGERIVVLSLSVFACHM